MWGAAFLLSLAIAVEVGATAVLPRAEGFTNVGWSVVTLTGYNVAILLLALVVRQMDVSLAYAVWSGVGTALIAVLGAAFLGESMNAAKGAFIALIVVGVVGLNMVSTAHA
jgi:small multidrug resistance pump